MIIQTCNYISGSGIDAERSFRTILKTQGKWDRNIDREIPGMCYYLAAIIISNRYRENARRNIGQAGANEWRKIGK